MDKTLLGLAVWLFYLGGLFGFAMGMMKFFTGGTPAEYGVMGRRHGPAAPRPPAQSCFQSP